MKLDAKTGRPVVHALEARKPGSREMFFDRSGEMNAGSFADMLKSMQAFLNEVGSGRISTEENSGLEMSAKEANGRFLEACKAGGDAQLELGGQIGAAIKQTADRNGQARNLLFRNEVQQGQRPRVRAEVKEVQGAIATGPTEFRGQFIRGFYFEPEEVEVKANVLIENREVYSGSGNLVEDAYQQGFEQTAVQEDRMLVQLLTLLKGVTIPQHNIVTNLTPGSAASIAQELIDGGIPLGSLWMSADWIADMVSNTSNWQGFYDPATKYEIIKNGRLGTLLGMELRTEQHRVERLRVLEKGTMWLLGAPNYLGAMGDRGPIDVQNYVPSLQGVGGKGWFMTEMIHMVLTNSNALVFGKRT